MRATRLTITAFTEMLARLAMSAAFPASAQEASPCALSDPAEATAEALETSPPTRLTAYSPQGPSARRPVSPSTSSAMKSRP
jgi:hypothetical protein